MGVIFSVANSGQINPSTSLTVALNITDPAVNCVVATFFETGTGAFSSLKYDGGDMVLAYEYAISATKRIGQRYIINPPQGNKNCILTYNASVQLSMFVAAYKGVRPTSTVGGGVTATGTATPINGSVLAVPVGGLAVDGLFTDGPGGNPTVSGTQTSQAARIDNGNMDNMASYNATGVPGNVAFAYTKVNDSNNWWWQGMFLYPKGGGGSAMWWASTIKRKASQWSRFLADLRAGLVPPDVLRARYPGLVAV